MGTPIFDQLVARLSGAKHRMAEREEPAGVAPESDGAEVRPEAATCFWCDTPIAADAQRFVCQAADSATGEMVTLTACTEAHLASLQSGESGRPASEQS